MRHGRTAEENPTSNQQDVGGPSARFEADVVAPGNGRKGRLRGALGLGGRKARRAGRLGARRFRVE